VGYRNWNLNVALIRWKEERGKHFNPYVDPDEEKEWMEDYLERRKREKAR